ncbi:alpha-amylase [Vibrio sp. T187]|uniref:alpha-amylase family glycosyl hydrolase n=1 Tax=Vibrio TaxID=662 RepID=UPI0010C948C3|nr:MULTISPECIES: alpha-amylase family glycosyl hydrolase [Vibrio]MBW3695541.1 alpha-amylase [Vibrio sp. T187]
MERSVAYSAAASDVILHAFDWRYEDVMKQAKQISQLGYKSVLVSPPMKSLISPQGTKWWQRYQPQDYRVIDNQLGNTQDFISMVEALREHGLRTYVDVVFNHMANESGFRNDLAYPNAQDLQSYRDRAEYFEKQRLFGDLSQPLFDEDDFVEAFGIKNWRDKWQVQNGRITGGPQDPGLPTLRDNEHVVAQQQAYLLALKKIGVRGFRIDAAKHMTIEHLKKVWTDEITEDMHIFGEIITDGGATKAEYELFLEPYLKHTRLGAYDFPLFNTISKAFTDKGSFTSLINPYCFGQALSYRRAITFTVTHDIPNNDVFLEHVMEETSERLAYSYILGRDGGVPLIYSDLNTSGITDQSGEPRWVEQWQSSEMHSMIAFHNHVHGERMKVLEANDDLLVFARGAKGVVVINKSKRAHTVSFSWQGGMTDLLSGEFFNKTEGNVEIKVKAKSSMMLV